MKFSYIVVMWLFVFTAAIVVIFKIPKVLATDHVLINEIYPNPKSGETEWIELYNPTNSDIDLSGYYLCDNTCTPTKSGAKLSDRKILANSYLTLDKSKDFTFALNNDGDIVSISSGGLIIDSVSYGNFDDGNVIDNSLAPLQGKSIARFPNGTDSGNNKNDFKIMVPTNGGINIKPVYSDKVSITEILPQPSNGSDNEFIEIYNSDTTPIDLTGWYIDDAEEGSTPYTIPDFTIINPSQYISFYKSRTGISLNDDGDSARLIDPNGEEKSMIKYDKAISGQSYANFTDGWSWTTILTPGSENVLTPNNMSDPQILSISELKKLAAGKTGVTEGTVTVLPDVLSDQYFYIQDDSGGIQIYSYYKEFPPLTLGDKVHITGEISKPENESRLKIKNADDIIVISSGPEVLPQQIELSEISSDNLGKYLEISGVITQTSGSIFYLADNNQENELKVEIKSGTKIQKPKMRRGNHFEISGILSTSSNKYLILPTKQEDVKIMSLEELPQAGSGLTIPLIITSIVFILWNLSPVLLNKLMILQKKSH